MNTKSWPPQKPEAETIKDLLDRALTGKTIASWRWYDTPNPAWDEEAWPGLGVVITFTDGTSVTFRELGQAGEIGYEAG